MVTSTSLRERGNEWFKRASLANTDEERVSRLVTARSLYERCLSLARTSDECASAHRNLGIVITQIAQLVPQRGSHRSELLKQSIVHKCQAHVTGLQAGKGEVWMRSTAEGIGASIDLLIKELATDLRASSAKSGAVMHSIRQLIGLIPEATYDWKHYCICGMLREVCGIASQMINPEAGTSQAQKGEVDWIGCKNLIAEANGLLIEALQMALDSDDNKEVNALLQLEDDLYVLECRCLSSQARLQGDELLQCSLRKRVNRSAPQQEEPSNTNQPTSGRRVKQKRQTKQAAPAAADAAAETSGRAEAAASVEASKLDGLVAAIDMYRSAAVLARERDLQAEAQALSRLGHLYKECSDVLDPVLLGNTEDGSHILARSAEERSRDAFLRVLLLVDAIPHRISLMMEDWYREARDAISAYQASQAAAAELQREAERAPIREALREELSALYDAANKGWVELIKHCYQHHPPINPSNRLPSDVTYDASNGKDLLRKAILGYHPDKQGAADVSLKWKVLAEEITKQLTKKYECFK